VEGSARGSHELHEKWLATVGSRVSSVASVVRFVLDVKACRFGNTHP